MTIQQERGRSFTGAEFDKAYEDRILVNHFFEQPKYYRDTRRRYLRSLEHIVSLPLPRPARVLEIGGGQLALLMSRMFRDTCDLADLSDQYADAVTKFGITFYRCNLLYDDLPQRDHYDLVILCEVVEHLPVPLHLTLEKVSKWMKPGGYLFITTPNVYRLRNVVRLALGAPIFGHFFYPEPGHSLGHPLEYSEGHVRWQIERAGFQVVYVKLRQLANIGSTWVTRLARLVASPALSAYPLWRDSLVACAKRPEEGAKDEAAR